MVDGFPPTQVPPRRPRAAPRPSAVLGIAAVVVVAAALAVMAAPARRSSSRPAAKPAPASRARPAPSPARASLPPRPVTPGTIPIGGPWRRPHRLLRGEVVEISVRVEHPSLLPPNGRLAVEWSLLHPDAAERPVSTLAPATPRPYEIPPRPTAGWRKVLHALDTDAYVVYRAPVSGTYELRLAPVTEEAPVGEGPRWREKGLAPQLFPLPSSTPWPAGTRVSTRVHVGPLATGNAAEEQRLGTVLEVEPNDTPELAQPLALVAAAGVRTYEITGTADDIEYFDNGRVGRSGEDWYRVTLQADGPRLLTAQLSMPGQFLAARIRAYRLAEGATADVPFGATVPVTEFFGDVDRNRLPWQEGKQVEVALGRDPNERVHQQEEEHRANITRLLQPGVTYYLRVEANHPGYQLQLRVLRPAPYTDPRLAVRQALYTQVGQVDAWLTNRPRGASVERRIRDTGNLLGTQCMSCHTQSGVWGPAVPVLNGYRVENKQNFWHLLNVMYECLRPTNVLKDAANNTSLATLDLGDGPAGTRAAGFNIVNAERVAPPRKLHSMQQLRTANFVLQSGDPGGINAAGPGSNVGQAIVKLFAAEILNTAWRKTGEPRYFRALEEKARDVARLQPRFTDDIAVRLEFFSRVFPLRDYPEQLRRAQLAERTGAAPAAEQLSAAGTFVTATLAQLDADEGRLRAIQHPDGAWGFNPGSTPDSGRTWRPAGDPWDPAPTALALSALHARGHGSDDPAVARGVQFLLRTQDPNGRWNRAAITGFVTTAYVLHALSRLYPETPHKPGRAEFLARPGETPLGAVRRVQALALNADPAHQDLLLQAAGHAHPFVRYWAFIGLGATHADSGVPVLLGALREPRKPLRDAAIWALRQTLLDDRGWDAVLAAGSRGDDHTREGVMQVLGMRVDGVLPRSTVGWDRLTRLLDRAMNEDPHPGVRAWAAKAAWQWWIWNPPVRPALNAAWIRMLERPEPNLLVEHSNRYSTHALFIANGHKANGSAEHQYTELAALFEALRLRLERLGEPAKSLLARRLVAVAGTFYQTSGGDGGPGQMGYVTPGSGALMGQAVLVYLRGVGPGGSVSAITAGLEGAANIPHGPLQEYLIDYALNAPEELRRVAAEAVSDPRSAMLEAAPERVEPLIAQVRRGAAEPARRATLSDPVLKLFGTVNWIIPRDLEQQRHFLDLLIPSFPHFRSAEELLRIADAGERAAAEREMDAAWYLADRLGRVLADNPDLHLDLVFTRYFPAEPRNPLERHYWVRSVPWLLEHKHNPAEPPAPAGAPPREAPVPAPPDPGLVTKDRALQLFLDALRPDALPATRAAAVSISNHTSVRRNPEVLLALQQLLSFEKDEQLRKVAQNVVNQGSDRFVPDLVVALKAEQRPGRWLLPGDRIHPRFLEDLVYFRDYIIPELARVKRSDQASCMGCHAVPGRVPSFTLRPTDQFGYQSVADLLFNYREMQARVDLREVDRSKILRKPLNVQDGKEDGHQGGRRYLPGDEGYLLLKRWAENQPGLLREVFETSLRAPGAQLAQARLARQRAERPRRTPAR